MGISRDSEDLVPTADSADDVYTQDVVGKKSDTIAGNSLVALNKQVKNFIDSAAPLVGNARQKAEVYYVDGTNGNDSNDGLSWATAKLTIQNALNLARYDAGTTDIDDDLDHDAFVFVAPGQYNEQLLFSGYGIHLIGLQGGAKLSNKAHGVTVNYDGAVTTTCVCGVTGARIEIAGITFNCNAAAIPIIWIPTPGDGFWIHDCFIEGEDTKTVTDGILACSIKSTVIENNVIYGCADGIECGIGGGAWFSNCVIKDNRISGVTRGIYVNNGAVVSYGTSIQGNLILASSKSIDNDQASDIIITENRVKPALEDAGAAAGDNTTLA